MLTMIRSEGVLINHNNLYAEERLQVRRRGGCKRDLETRAPMALPQGPNRRLQGARVILLRPANWAKHSFG
jgi:putative transposase